MSIYRNPRHEFDYVEERSCMRAQCNCLCGTGSCRFPCRGCPPMKESTVTRVIYVFFLMLGILTMALFMSTEIQAALLNIFPDNFALCERLGVGRACQDGRLIGYVIVYRIGFAIALYHLVLMVSTIGVKSSKDCRAGLHNGFWLYKLMLIFVLLLVAFLIPDHNDYFINVWMYIAMIGAAAFIVIQLVLIVFMVHMWTDKIQHRVNESGGSPFLWYALFSPILAAFLFALSLCGICLLYIYFANEQGCFKNQWFILLNAGSCVIVSVVAAFKSDTKPVGLRLLHASLISLYVTYLTWIAISSAPRRFQGMRTHTYPNYGSSRKGMGVFRPRYSTALTYQEYYCGPYGGEETWADHIIPYVSFAITFVTVIYGSLGVSEAEKCEALALPGCPPKAEEVEEVDREDVGGQIVIRNEKRSLVYSYALFHAMLMLACLLMVMHLTHWHTPNRASLVTFGRSWSSVWIKISSSWVCLLIYFVTILCPSILPSVIPSFVPMAKAPSFPVIEMNGHAMESDTESAISEEAVPLTIIRRPTIITSHQETTV